MCCCGELRVLEGNYQLEVKVEVDQVEEGRGNCGQHGIKHGWTQKSETHSGVHLLPYET